MSSSISSSSEKLRFFAGFGLAFACFAGLAAVLLALSAWQITSRYGWTASVLGEREQLLLRSQPPRLVIIAGSGGLFGISAKILERETGIRAFNASTHAALSWDAQRFFVLSKLKEGDVALLPLELAYFGRDPRLLNTTVVETAHSLGLRYFWSLDGARKLGYLKLLSPSFLAEQVAFAVGAKRLDTSRGYWRLPSDGAGDLNTETAYVAKAVNPVPIPVRTHSGAMDQLCADVKELEQRDVTVIVTEPNGLIAAEAKRKYLDFLSPIRKTLAACGAQYVSTTDVSRYSRPDFLDTGYHLTSGARSRRTSELARALCAQALDCRPSKNHKR